MTQGLGRWAIPEDPQSRKYAYVAPPISVLRTVSHGAYAPITDQDGLGGCVGWSDLDIVNMSKFAASRKRVTGSTRYLTNDKGEEFYHLATIADEWPNEEYPPVDLGSSVLAGCKVLKQLGYIDRYEWAYTFEDMLVALQHGPVIMGTTWTNGMFDPDKNGLVKPTGDLAGGHAYTVRGMNVRTQLLRCRNHWTADWGRDGEFYLTFNDMEWLLAQHGDCVVPVPL